MACFFFNLKNKKNRVNIVPYCHEFIHTFIYLMYSTLLSVERVLEANHPLLLASSSLGFGSVLRSHFSVPKLERFMRVRLVLRRLHLRYLHFPLARLSYLGFFWRLRGFFFFWALVVRLVESLGYGSKRA